MLTIYGRKQRYCDGVNRRDFLRVGALGAGLTLTDMLRFRAQATDRQGGTPRLKSAIMIYLPGGPSHMDMYDLKPNAPAEFRGEFRPINTNVPGVQISQHFPQQARMWDKLACIRSLVSVNEHSDSMVMTGHSDRDMRTGSYPSFGSMVSYMRGNLRLEAPSFVSLRGMTRGTEPAYLGVQHRPFTPNGPGLRNLSPLREVNVARQSNRRSLLGGFDGLRSEIDVTGEFSGLDNFTQQAFDIVSSGAVRRALDVRTESNAVRQRYRGVESFLTARRLVEAGAGVVTLRIGGWDTHGNNFRTLSRQLPQVDRGLSNLIQDLHDRGMGDDVITVMWGEFGRTPRVNRNAGRDHWPSVMSAFIAGGGLRMGQAVGTSTARGERPLEGRCSPSQVLSTMYHAMGIDPGQTILDNSGRPRHILTDREPIRELLG